jgi:hypothetical protein
LTQQPVGGFGEWVHWLAPHSGGTLYYAAAVAALLSISAVYARCLWTGSTKQLPMKWVFRTAAEAAPIPTYVLLMLIPADPDLAACVLEDRVIVALAGLYGLVEALKSVRQTATEANARRAVRMPPTE